MTKLATYLLLFLFASAVAQNNSNTLPNFDQNAQSFDQYDVIQTSNNTLDASLRNIATDIQALEINFFALTALQNEQPEFIRFSFAHQGDTLNIKLQRHEVLSSDFQVRNQDDELLDYNSGLYYRGKVNNDANSFVVFNFFQESLNGIISQRGKGNRIIGQLKNQDQYMVYSDHKMSVNPDFTCDVNDIEQVQDLAPQNAVQTNSQATSNCVRVFYELTNSIYINNNSSVNQTTNWITSLHNIVATLYSDENIPTVLSDVLIWQQTDPYTGSNGDKLNDFRETRNAVNGDLAHLVDTPSSGGVAYINSLCQNTRYAFSGLSMNYAQLPTYSWAVNVVTHEMGHSVGSPHTHACFWNGNNTAIDSCGPDNGFSEGCDNGPIPTNGGTIMSYCHLDSTGVNLALGFHPQVSSYIDNNIDTKSCLGTDCVDSCMQTIADVTVTQNDFNSLTINIDDVISDSWDYRIYEQSTAPGSLNTTSNNTIDISNIQQATYYVIDVANNCSNGNYGGGFQTVYLTDANWCSGVTFTDSGGSNGNYQNNENFVRTFYPNQSNQKISVTLNEFNTEDNDIMNIYDGESTDAPVFFLGEDLSGSAVPAFNFEATNPAGAITIEFTADGSVNAPGWEIFFTCETFSTDEFNENDIKLFPNPFADQFNIQSDIPVDELVIYSINGQRVYRKEFSAQSNLNIKLNDISSGVYLMEISSGQSSITKRLIKR